jgi:hypothetical protein
MHHDDDDDKIFSPKIQEISENEFSLRVFHKRVLRRIFEPRR